MLARVKTALCSEGFEQLRFYAADVLSSKQYLRGVFKITLTL
jgi:hypothetical protein